MFINKEAFIKMIKSDEITAPKEVCLIIFLVQYCILSTLIHREYEVKLGLGHGMV